MRLNSPEAEMLRLQSVLIIIEAEIQAQCYDKAWFSMYCGLNWSV